MQVTAMAFVRLYCGCTDLTPGQDRWFISKRHIYPDLMFHNRSEHRSNYHDRFILSNGTSGLGLGYFHRMSSATFCLAPLGIGWGARVKTAITRGCIPVIIQV